jgi:hypothetical protein
MKRYLDRKSLKCNVELRRGRDAVLDAGMNYRVSSIFPDRLYGYNHGYGSIFPATTQSVVHGDANDSER